MLNIKTPLRLIQRRPLKINGSIVAVPGTWAYLDSSDRINNIASTSTNQAQSQCLKMIGNYDGISQYETRDVKVGRITGLESVFRAAVDGSGYQTQTTDGSTIQYVPGMELTPAYLVTTTPTPAYEYAYVQDIGKLRPAILGDVVVARFEKFDESGNFNFMTVTQHSSNVDSTTPGTGSLLAKQGKIKGVGTKS